MEIQLCNYDKKSNTTRDMQCNFIIIILTIIYNILIGIIIFIKQPIIKEVPVEVIKEVIVEVPVEVIKEVEVIKYYPVEVIKEVEIIDKVVTEENNEEELLLANYNTKERALALQAAYKEQLQVLFEKRMNILKNLSTFKPLSVNELPSGWTLETLFGGYGNQCNHLLTVNNLLLSKISEKVRESMSKDIETIDDEILIISKKAGLFQVDSDLLNDLHKCIEPTNQFYNDYKDELLKI